MPFPSYLTKRWGREIGWVCEVCGREWADGWKLEAHHIIPVHNGGKNTRDNWILLCQECHIEAHEELSYKNAQSADLIRKRFERDGGRWK